MTRCRHDWYQSQTYVSISVFAKNVVKEKCQVNFETEKVEVVLQLSDESLFEKTFQLNHVTTLIFSSTLFLTCFSPNKRKFEQKKQPINPNQSKVDFLSTKVEIKLSKMEPIQWHYLEK